MIRSGVYLNWPAAGDTSTIGRLFVGTNALGIWDELFFICTCFALLRRHLRRLAGQPDPGRPVHVVPLGTRLPRVGPSADLPVRAGSGVDFKLTRSLTYIVCVHLLFDFVLFLVLVHAHNRHWLAFFLY